MTQSILKNLFLIYLLRNSQVFKQPLNNMGMEITNKTHNRKVLFNKLISLTITITKTSNNLTINTKKKIIYNVNCKINQNKKDLDKNSKNNRERE